MSIAIAVRKNHHIALVADTQTAIHGHEVQPQSNYAARKILTIQDGALAFTGQLVYCDLFAHFLQHADVPSVHSAADAFSMIHQFWRFVRDDLSVVGPSQDETNYLVDLDLQLLIVLPHLMLEVDGHLRVRQYQHYCAVGSASEYAYGALACLIQSSDSAKEIAMGAAQIASSFDLHSGGELQSIEIREARN